MEDNGTKEIQHDLADREKELFLVLEGGGAKGIAHIAAWKALDRLVSKPHEPLKEVLPIDLGEDRFRLTGVAGTSAGAVVAAFIAAGAKAADLIDDNGKVPLCNRLGMQRFHDIFSVREWRRLKFIRGLQGPSGLLHRQARKFIETSDRPGRAAGNTSHNPEKTSNPIRNLDAYAQIAAAGTAIALFYFLLDNLGIFRLRGAEAKIFLLFWFVSYALSLFMNNIVLRQWEKKKYKNRNRYFSDLIRLLFHPLSYLLASLVITFFLARNISPVESAYFLFGLSLFALMAIALTAAVIVRGFLKGTVNSINLQRDINEALKIILTDSIARIKGSPENKSVLAVANRIKLPDYQVTFNDLTSVTGLSLSLVTSDIIKNEVCVYSSDTSPEFSVAQAVTGSISIPFAFCFVPDETRVLFDGGLISSLPAWLYRRARTRDPDCRILAIGIEPDEYDTWIPAFFVERQRQKETWRAKAKGYKVGEILMDAIASAYIFIQVPIVASFWPVRIALNVASTAVFGGRSLDLDASDRLDSISLRPNLGLLDFDIPPARAKAEIEGLQNSADTAIRNLLWHRKIAFHRVGKWIEDSLRTLKGEREELGRIRVFWAELDGSKAVRIKLVFGFTKKDLDDRLVLPFRSSMTAWAAETRLSQFGHATTLEEMLSEPMNRYRKAVKWPDRKWCWTIPVEKEGKLAGVLAIEGSEELTVYDPDIGQIGASRSDAWLDSTGKLRRRRDGSVEAPPARNENDAMSELENYWKAGFVEQFLSRPDLPMRPRISKPSAPGHTSTLIMHVLARLKVARAESLRLLNSLKRLRH